MRRGISCRCHLSPICIFIVCVSCVLFYDGLGWMRADGLLDFFKFFGSSDAATVEFVPCCAGPCWVLSKLGGTFVTLLNSLYPSNTPEGVAQGCCRLMGMGR